MRQLLVSPSVRCRVHCTGGDIQRMNTPEAECPEAQAEYSSRDREDTYLDQVLHEDLPAAGPQRTAHA